MNGRKDGGPAFASAAFGGPNQEGMSLRDYFAAAVLQGLVSRECFDEGAATPQQRAHLAYIDADAMLAERAK